MTSPGQQVRAPRDEHQFCLNVFLFVLQEHDMENYDEYAAAIAIMMRTQMGGEMDLFVFWDLFICII